MSIFGGGRVSAKAELRASGAANEGVQPEQRGAWSIPKYSKSPGRRNTDKMVGLEPLRRRDGRPLTLVLPCPCNRSLFVQSRTIRQSTYPLTTVEAGLELVLQAATPLAVEDVVLTADGCCAALGRILAADVTNKVRITHDWLQPRVFGWCGPTLWMTAARRWEPITTALLKDTAAAVCRAKISANNSCSPGLTRVGRGW